MAKVEKLTTLVMAASSAIMNEANQTGVLKHAHVGEVVDMVTDIVEGLKPGYRQTYEISFGKAMTVKKSYEEPNTSETIYFEPNTHKPVYSIREGGAVADLVVARKQLLSKVETKKVIDE